jgi:hypothetical protein
MGSSPLSRREPEAALKKLACVVGAAACAAVAATPAGAAAPAVCTADVVHQTLIAAGKLTQQDIDEFGVKVDLLRCADVTDDGASDALFTLASGGTAGDTVFGVVRGNPDGTAGALVLYKQAYKVGVARHSRRSFDVIQPHYGKNDPNCCPSSFRQRRYTWTGTRFKAGKAKKVSKAPRRFYRP